DIGVGVEGLDRAEQLILQGDVERVERLRSVEADDADAAAPFDDDGLRAHGGPWLSFGRHAVTAPRAPKTRVASDVTEQAVRCAAPLNIQGAALDAGFRRTGAPTARHAAPCKEQAENRETKPAIVSHSPRLVFAPAPPLGLAKMRRAPVPSC